MIQTLYDLGRLQEKVPGGPDLTDVDMKAAMAARIAKTNAAKM